MAVDPTLNLRALEVDPGADLQVRDLAAVDAVVDGSPRGLEEGCEVVHSHQRFAHVHYSTTQGGRNEVVGAHPARGAYDRSGPVGRRASGDSVSRVLKQRLRHRVIVTLRSGEAFDGVLWEADGTAWVLRNAAALAAGQRGTNVALDGEVVLLVSEISYAQRP